MPCMASTNCNSAVPGVEFRPRRHTLSTSASVPGTGPGGIGQKDLNDFAMLRSRTLLLYGALYSAAWLPQCAAACDPLLTDQRTAFENVLEVRGRESATRRLLLPAPAHVVVLAHESGVDVTLQVKDGARVVAVSDSPIRRSGIQRIVFRTERGADYSVEVVGKDAGAQGEVLVRAVAYTQEPVSSCFALQRLLGEAEIAYARGQSVTRSTGPAGSAGESAYKASAAAYRAAVPQLASADAPALLAQVRHSLAAVLYQGTQEWETAAAEAEIAAQAYAAAEDDYGKARAQALQAAALLETSAAARTRELLAPITAFHERRGELYDQALALNNIGIAYYYDANYDEAVRHYKLALALQQRTGDLVRQAQALSNIALVESELGRASDSVAHFEQILHLVTSAQDPLLYLGMLSSSAIAHWTDGNLDAALRQYNEALSLSRQIQYPFYEAMNLQGIGCIYAAVGDLPLALEFMQRALALRTQSLDRRGRIETLRWMGNVLRRMGRAEEALAADEEALSLASRSIEKASIELQVARDLGALGRREAALSRLNTLLKQRITGDEFIRARALLERGQQHLAGGALDFAAADLRNALRTFRSYEAPEDEFQAWLALARVHRQRGARGDAFAAVETALNIAEQLRLRTTNPQLRASLLQPFRPAFDLKISMLAEDYFAASAADAKRRIALRALQTAEQSRARSLQDFRRLEAAAADSTPQLGERRAALYRELAARRTQLLTILDRFDTEDPAARSIRGDILDLRRTIDQLDAQAAAATGPGRNALHVESLDLRSLPADLGAIAYWLGEDQSFAWTLTTESIVLTNLGTTAGITASASALHSSLRALGAVPAARRLRLAERLGESVWAPLRRHVDGKRTLIFVADQMLHYVPFSALRIEDAGRQRFLVEDHDVAVAPSVTTLLGVPAASGPARARMLLVDDPVYGAQDERAAAALEKSPRQAPEQLALVARGSAGDQPFARLPGTAREASAIAALLGGGVDRLEGFSATRRRFLDSPLESYRYIHIASHAVADAEVPQLSALMLSAVDDRGTRIDNQVFAADFMNVRLNAELVVLSACDTALGKSVAGEGLMGLRYAMLARGARTVASSLWRAPDSATEQLMVRFYSSLLRDRLTPVQAMSSAKRALLSGRFADPAAWGAFELTITTVR